MNPIRVAINGASGKMGREIINAVCREPGLELVGAVELQPPDEYLSLPDGSGAVPFSADLEHILATCQPDVLVDFTRAQATMPAVRTAVKHGVNLVIGTTGLSADDIEEIDRLAREHQVGAIVAPNFTIGAVLMIHMAKIAAKHFDYAEITELHHHQKADAPSGTALSTARAMAAAKGKSFSYPEAGKPSASRGQQVDGITIHSVRLPGLVAHQEVLLGGPGQTLSIRHDTINRECYMPGIILAIREAVKRKGLVHGLDTLLGL
ncbi:MAG TPA: 4-hydroxy-tetrahydrodipicolinate reductase [Dehalococcoidia bacterium]|nr:4-hydroxy-tetrahydrodipicolinate reductase [Dehalococcoidia bacterium]